MEFGLNFCIYFFFNDLHWAGRLVMGLKILEGGLLRLEFGLNFCIYLLFSFSFLVDLHWVGRLVRLKILEGGNPK